MDRCGQINQRTEGTKSQIKGNPDEKEKEGRFLPL